MFLQPSNTAETSSRSKLAVMLLFALLTMFVAVPEAEAACPGTGFALSGGLVELDSCTSEKVATNLGDVTLSVPGNLAAVGDLLVAVIALDGNRNFSPTGGWVQLVDQTGGNNDVTVGVFTRVTDGLETASYLFNWNNNEQSYSYMMRFTGASGQVRFSTASGQNNTGAAVAPDLETFIDDTLLLRIFAQDDDDYGPPADDTVVTGYVTVTEDESNGGNGTVSSSAAYLNQGTAGLVGTATFAGGGNEQWAAVTLGIEPAPAPAPAFCFDGPATDGTVIGGQLVVLESCYAARPGTVEDIVLLTPTGTQLGDLLIAVISGDADEVLTIEDAPGFVAVDVGNAGAAGPTLGIYQKIADATDVAGDTYTFTTAGIAEGKYGYVLRFSGASGTILPTLPIAVQTGNSLGPITDAITTAVAQTLVMRILAVDNNRLIRNSGHVATQSTGAIQRAILQDRSGGVGLASAYYNQEVAGDTGSAQFAVTDVDTWRATTLGVEPYEFRFFLEDGASPTQSSVCSIKQVTLRVTRGDGTALPFNYTGTVNLSTELGNGDWSDTVGLNANSLTGVGAADSGIASYTFAAVDANEVILNFTDINVESVNFNVTDAATGRWQESTSPGYVSPDLIVSDCEFRIVFGSDPSNVMGTCAAETITMTLFDLGTNLPAADYPGGAITINNGGGDGFYSFVSGDGSVSANPSPPGGDGTTVITFGAGDSQIVLAYSDFTAGTGLVFSISEDSGRNITQAGGNPTLDVYLCEIYVTVNDLINPGSDQGDVCTVSSITFGIFANGTAVTNFDGDLSIQTTTGQGEWLNGGARLTNNSLGSAGYAFDGALDPGSVTLDLSHPFLGAVNFTVSAVADNGALVAASVVPANIDTLTVVPCLVLITGSAATSDACRNGQIITYTIQDRGGNGPVTNFVGTIVLNSELDASAVKKGNWEVDNGFDNPQLPAQLNNGTADNGIASLQFVDADNGSIQLRYVNENLGLWNLQLGGTEFTAVAGTFAAITVSPCYFKISYDDDLTPLTPAESDVCSIETVTISLVDSSGTAITDLNYVGTITLSTSGAGGGTWGDPISGPANVGALTPGPAESGIASYAFAIGDAGEVTLSFTSLTSGTRNINATDGPISDLGGVHATDDPSLNVGLCTYWISYTNGVDYDPASTSACSFQDVTIEVRDSGDGLASNYAGDIRISVPANKGDWSNSAALDPAATPGNFSNGTADDGEMTYRFNGDGGSVNFRFTSQQAGDYNFEIENVVGETVLANIATGIAGEIVEDSLRDPTLTITSCFPTVTATACASRTGPGTNGDTVSLTIAAGSALNDRIIIAVAAREGVGATPNAPSFNAIPMTLLHREQDVNANGSSLEMWYLFEAGGIPAGPGPYNGFFDGATAANWGYCFLSLAEVAQVLPVHDGGTGETGTLNYENNGYEDIDNLALNAISTTITTTVNNSLVLSAVSSADASPAGYVFDDVSPQPPLIRLWGATDVSNPEYLDTDEAQFAGAAGVAAIAASITVDEIEDDYNPTADTHIVAAFEPRFTGPPIAVGYEPVKLFKTYSGNMSYRAIGATLRASANGAPIVGNPGDPTDGCEFITPNGPTFADLNLPSGSTVEAAWLYWSGSGSDDLGVGTTGTDSQVTLTNDPNGGSPVASIVNAVEVFVIDNAIGNLDFFAGYADVTNLITSGVVSREYSLSNLLVDNGSPWSDNETCAGGWSLIVVYENPQEQFRVINLFQGFQPFQNSAFTLVPRNFRMHKPEAAGNLPNGQITHFTIEGDFTLATGDESLGIQKTPGSTDFTFLTTDFNPTQAEFNSTITRPKFQLVSVNGSLKWLFDPVVGPVGNVSNGYELDFPKDTPTVSPPYAATDEVGLSWGVDIDTHYVQGTVSGEPLFAFAQAQSEELTTRYSSGQDLVMLVSEVISVTNEAIADITITKSGPIAATVDTTAAYTFTVTNNGDGTVDGGYADGQIIVTDILPAGMTFDTVGTSNDDVSGTDWACTETDQGIDPGAFTCIYEIATDYNYTSGDLTPNSFPLVNLQLGKDEFLPPITANVKIGNSVTFPAQSTAVINVARVLHSGGSDIGLPCTESVGISPDPTTCKISPQFDNKNDLLGGTLNINDIDAPTANNNNVSAFETAIKGIETDLSISKTLVGILEAGQTAQYIISVTNNGPDQTTTQFTFLDPIPSLLSLPTVDPATDPRWNCTTAFGLFCRFDGPGWELGLADGQSVDMTVNYTIDPDPGSSGETITNIATVSTAAGNFDPDNDNTAVSAEQVVPPVAETTEKFLLSVSQDLISLGGIQFGKDDLVLWDPDSLSASPFFINTVETEIDVDDINAVHLLQNGHIVMSVNGPSTATDIVGGFGPEDIVVWDPILKTTTLLFEGTGKFDEVENIDAVYILENGDIVFSTVDEGSWNSDTIAWDKSDLLRWDGSSVTKYLDGSDSTVFDTDAANAQVDAVYVRAADANANAVKNTFWLSASTDPLGDTVTAGTNAGPFLNAFGQDDLLELADPNSEITPLAGPSTGNLLFSGDVAAGVFSGANSGINRIDGVHIVESGYHGHFSIVEVLSGTTCTPGTIRISKHLGSSHLVDDDYAGTITIKSSNGEGSWSAPGASGTLNDLYKIGGGVGTAVDGEASYTFAVGDTGTVVLTFTTGLAGMPQSFDVDVSNQIITELDIEDADFNFLDDITNVTFKDTFDSVSFARNDGVSSWDADWADIDPTGSGAATGNIKVESDKLSITATSGLGANPSISRFASFSFVPTEDVFLNFDYTYEFLNGAADEITIEVSDDASNWTELATYTGIDFTGTNLVSPVAQSLNISDLIAPANTIDDLSGGVSVRISVTQGYLAASKFFFDNIEIATGTNACGVGSIGHYAIFIDGITASDTGPSGDTFNGISCAGSLITIAGHNGTDSLVEPGEKITLQTSTNKGSWASVVVGTPSAFSDIGNLTDGSAEYTFQPGETSATFRFNYTDPVMDGDLVNFNIVSTTGYTVNPQEDPTLKVSLAGLRFFNESAMPAAEGIPNQIASKPSDTGFNSATIAIQAVKSSDQDPLQCVPLFEDMRTLDFEFALECADPLGCAAEDHSNDNVGLSYVDDLDAYVNDVQIPRVTDNAADGASVYGTAFPIDIINQPSGIPGGTIKFEYKDAGDVRLNARWQIRLDDDTAGLVVDGDYLTGDWAFNVRPFGLDIDFGRERFSATTFGGSADVNLTDSFADADDDTVFATAGESFTATVSAMGWQAGDDDDDNDGIPDAGADLSDNQVTRNFGNETTKDDYDVLLELTQVVAPASGVGVLTASPIADFADGVASPDIIFDEVGIIDLNARLVQNGTAVDDTFMGLNSAADPGSVLKGAVKNVGRFVPADFVLTLGSITNRSLARVQPSCSAPMSNFTYMGEQFGFSATVTARNALQATTKNYVGLYAKLNAADFPASRFAAVDQLDGNADLSVRLADGPGGANRVVTWGSDPGADGGIAILTGDLVFNRAPSTDSMLLPNEQPEDGPYTAITLGLLDTVVSTEFAGVTRPFVLDLDRGNTSTDDATALADTAFRYGRLILENAFGSETEPLQIAFRVEYWDGPANGFVLNSDDSCTTIEFDSSTPLSNASKTDERSIRFLDGDNLLGDDETVLQSFEGNLDATEVKIEELATAASASVIVGLVGGVTAGPLETSGVVTDFESDRLLEVSAPGIDTVPDPDEPNDGAVYIEFNLTDTDLLFSLDFLSYDWRTDPTDLDDVTADQDHTDNPRARLDFGSYRGHDRVINWQEIYIGPTSQ